MYYDIYLTFHLNVNFWDHSVILQVIRAGRQVEVSICDIVVGDVIPLKIGDEVCRFIQN